MKLVLFLILTASIPAFADTAIFAGGCFWCMEAPFDELKGVTETTSGYSGGQKEKPTYEEVSAGGTGHYEVVQVTYDPKVVNYEKLLEVYWHNVDFYDDRGQFCDKGQQYKSVIFYNNEAQKNAAEASKASLPKSKSANDKVVTEILPAKTFYAAEDYHQNYYKKNPIRYKFYRSNCGRDSRLKELWKK